MGGSEPKHEPLSQAEVDAIFADLTGTGPGFTPQPRHVTPWRHCAVAVARWAWERWAPFPPRSRLRRRLTRVVHPQGTVTGRVVGWWCGRLERRVARVEGMGR